MHDVARDGDAAVSSAVSIHQIFCRFELWDDRWDALPMAMYACDADGLIAGFNRRAVAMWGRTPALGDPADRFCGGHKLFRADGTRIRHDQTPMAEVLRTGQAVSGIEVGLERPDGSRISAQVHIDPILDAGGELIGAINCFQDVTELKQARRAADRQEVRFRELLDALPAAIYTTDAAGRITFYNKAAESLAGRAPTLGSDEWCVSWRLFRSDGTPLPHDECPMAVALREKRPIRDGEAVLERPDGTRVPFIPFPTPLHDEQGRVVGAVNMLVDISERKEAEWRQKILVDELNHRVKNTLAAVQALANHSFRSSGMPAEARHLFEARLLALSQVHDQLAQAEWQSAELRSLLQGLVWPYAEEGRLSLNGGPVRLSPKVAVTLTMVVHELATNAAKYGSLSGPDGKLSVSWDVSVDRLRLDWEETDGPPARPPVVVGFGTKLMERGIVKELGGWARVHFEPQGFRCHIEVPLRSLDG